MVGILRLTQKQKNKLTNGSVNYINFDKSTMIKKEKWTIVTRLLVMFFIVFGAMQISNLNNIPNFLQISLLVIYLINFIVYMPYYSLMYSFDSDYVYHIFEKRVYVQEKRTKVIFENIANKCSKLKGNGKHIYNVARVVDICLLIGIYLFLFQSHGLYKNDLMLYSISSLIICFVMFVIMNLVDFVAGYLLSPLVSNCFTLLFIGVLFFYCIGIVCLNAVPLTILLKEFVDSINVSLDISAFIQFYNDFLLILSIEVINNEYRKIKSHRGINDYIYFFIILIFAFSLFGENLINNLIINLLIPLFI